MSPDTQITVTSLRNDSDGNVLRSISLLDNNPKKVFGAQIGPNISQIALTETEARQLQNDND